MKSNTGRFAETVFVVVLLLILSDCGLKLITESDLDRHCFGCESAGYSLCASGAREIKHTSLTQDETDKILLILKNAARRDIIKNGSIDWTQTPADITKGVPINLDGYKRLE